MNRFNQSQALIQMNEVTEAEVISKIEKQIKKYQKGRGDVLGNVDAIVKIAKDYVKLKLNNFEDVSANVQAALDAMEGGEGSEKEVEKNLRAAISTLLQSAGLNETFNYQDISDFGLFNKKSHELCNGQLINEVSNKIDKSQVEKVAITLANRAFGKNVDKKKVTEMVNRAMEISEESGSGTKGAVSAIVAFFKTPKKNESLNIEDKDMNINEKTRRKSKNEEDDGYEPPEEGSEDDLEILDNAEAIIDAANAYLETSDDDEGKDSVAALCAEFAGSVDAASFEDAASALGGILDIIAPMESEDPDFEDIPESVSIDSDEFDF